MEPTEPLALEGDTIIIGSPDQFAADWNESKHAQLLTSLAPIALGHPLGCTGCKLTIQITNDLKRLKRKYGIVTACVGGGQGIAGIIENIQ